MFENYIFLVAVVQDEVLKHQGQALELFCAPKRWHHDSVLNPGTLRSNCYWPELLPQAREMKALSIGAKPQLLQLTGSVKPAAAAITCKLVWVLLTTRAVDRKALIETKLTNVLHK